MISFVNDFLCSSSCDVAKAKHGVDPHPKTDEAQNAKPDATKNGVVVTDKDAVVFGGSLSPNAAVTPVIPSASVQSQAVNLLV